MAVSEVEEVLFPRWIHRGLIEGPLPRVLWRPSFPFRDGFIAASLKAGSRNKCPRRTGPFPRWIHRGLIEGGKIQSFPIAPTRFPRWIHRGLIEGDLAEGRPLMQWFFPRWIHRGLIEGQRKQRPSASPNALSAMDSSRPH